MLNLLTLCATITNSTHSVILLSFNCGLVHFGHENFYTQPYEKTDEKIRLKKRGAG